jgi:Skp family chaperone for outer membrane proteins
MIEIIATSIITVSSALLFGYWYRYTCLLILSAKTTMDYASEVARANQLSFSDVQQKLSAGAQGDLDRLQQSLDSDYARLNALFGKLDAEIRLEDRMLQLDYHLMNAFYKTTRRFSSNLAQHALEEMSMVVGHFANAFGERAAYSPAA